MNDLQQRIAEVLALADKATPGPYWCSPMDLPDGHALAWVSNWFIDTERPKPKGSHTRYLKPEDDAKFLRSAHDMAQIIRELSAELESMRKDSERYQFLRQMAGNIGFDANPFLIADDRIDRAIIDRTIAKDSTR